MIAASNVRRVRFMPLESIELDHRLQQREEGLVQSVVDDYVEHLDDLPPVIVYYDGKKYWLVSGFHRFAAHKKAGRTEIRCEIRDGSWLDAFVASLAENHAHGLKRTNADKRKAVYAALRENKGRRLGWSNKEIARKCCVSDFLIANVIKELREEITTLGRVQLIAQEDDSDNSDESDDGPPEEEQAPLPDPDFKTAASKAEEVAQEIADQIAERKEKQKRPPADPYYSVRDATRQNIEHLATCLKALPGDLLKKHQPKLDAMWADARKAGL